MDHLQILSELRTYGGKRKTTGLSDDQIKRFLSKDERLANAIEAALKEHKCLESKFADLLKLDEQELVATLQNSYVNFYTDDTVNPYVALAARGPWIITTKGAVLHDSGGYGMLGLGHAPEQVLAAMSQPYVMANVMTPSFSQKRLSERLDKEIGHRRNDRPFAKYLCMNSGSEAVTVALRISDINTAQLTEKNGRHQGKQVKFLALKGGFHGRTDRPSQASDSSLPKYRKLLASFQNRDNLVTIEPNNTKALREAFERADRENIFFECFLMEPVMGEGNPGQAISTEFYQAARELTAKHQTLFLVDSIQASLRAHGCVSIVDYPGFENLEPPDMETYSKALNAGQYPLSILAMRAPTAELYQRGVYGNTMTTNPRALEVACAVLDQITPEFRKNVQERGVEFVEKLKNLQRDFPDVITDVKGTGLLVSAAINPDRHKVVGFGCLEERMRIHGIGVIHGGENSLRFTPHFWITSEEIDLVIEVLRDILKAN